METCSRMVLASSLLSRKRICPQSPGAGVPPLISLSEVMITGRAVVPFALMDPLSITIFTPELTLTVTPDSIVSAALLTINKSDVTMYGEAAVVHAVFELIIPPAGVSAVAGDTLHSRRDISRDTKRRINPPLPPFYYVMYPLPLQTL